MWSRAEHSVDRAVRRVEQVVDGCPPGPERTALEAYLPRVDLVARAVRAACVRAQAEAPSEGFTVPGGPEGRHPEVHRRLTRTATACAQVAEAAAMVRVGGGSVDAVERAVLRAEELAGLR
ncbi:hypothetical protein [Kineococcus arenarius]|uniref:hypothetical protein n=1 Tax=Kineococcus sp. SYSU DK020 TaxID=3383141 RepID=UPI003D7CA571